MEDTQVLKKSELDALMNDIAQKVAKQVLTPEALKAALEPIMKTQVEAETQRLFSVREGSFKDGHFETKEGSAYNTGALYRAVGALASMQATGKDMSDAQFANIVLSNGGIYTKLSPAMQNFGLLLKSKLNANKLMNLGFKADEYQDQCMKQLTPELKQTGMNEGIGADGGFTVPVEYASTVIEFGIQASPILNKVWRVRMKSNSSKWPRLAQTDDSFFGGMVMTWLDEGHAKPEKKIAFEQVSFTAYKCAGIIVLTDELIEDSLINIVNYVTAVGIRAYMYELEHMVIDGTGVGQGLGIINDPVVVANAVARTAAAAIRFQDFNNLEAAMNENFRNMEWIMRRATLSAARNLVDNNNRPIWTQLFGMQNGALTPITNILDYPYNITRNANVLGHLGDVILGDLSFYMLATRKDMTIDVSPYPYWKTDETGVRFVARVDGKPGSPYAFKILSGTGS